MGGWPVESERGRGERQELRRERLRKLQQRNKQSGKQTYLYRKPAREKERERGLDKWRAREIAAIIVVDAKFFYSNIFDAK